jgi:hypothetical protein
MLILRFFAISILFRNRTWSCRAGPKLEQIEECAFPPSGLRSIIVLAGDEIWWKSPTICKSLDEETHSSICSNSDRDPHKKNP